MVIVCSVHNCKKQASKNAGISFHRFPINKPILMKKWLTAMKRDEKWKPYSNARVCGLHFDEADYQTSGWSSKCLLKPNAVPHIFNFSDNLREETNTRPLTIENETNEKLHSKALSSDETKLKKKRYRHYSPQNEPIQFIDMSKNVIACKDEQIEIDNETTTEQDFISSESSTVEGIFPNSICDVIINSEQTTQEDFTSSESNTVENILSNTICDVIINSEQITQEDFTPSESSVVEDPLMLTPTSRKSHPRFLEDINTPALESPFTREQCLRVIRYQTGEMQKKMRTYNQQMKRLEEHISNLKQLLRDLQKNGQISEYASDKLWELVSKIY